MSVAIMEEAVLVVVVAEAALVVVVVEEAVGLDIYEVLWHQCTRHLDSEMVLL